MPDRIRIRKHGLSWWAYALPDPHDEGMGTEHGPFVSFFRDAAIKRARRWLSRRNREAATEATFNA